MDPIEVHPGEKRYIAAELAALLAEGDSLASVESVEVVAKRGRAATTMLSTPAPAIDDTAVEFWIDVPGDQAKAIYLGLVTCVTAAAETIIEEVPIIVM